MNKSTHLHSAGLSDTNDPGKEGQQRAKKQSKSRVERERERERGFDWFKGMKAGGGVGGGGGFQGPCAVSRQSQCRPQTSDS